MSAATTPKLKFNEYLDQSMIDIAGGKEQCSKVKKVWERIKLKWTRAGCFSGGPPTGGKLQSMQEELEDAVEEARASETERNKIHMFRKEGTRERERAEAELKIGTWAIEESRRVQLQKKPDIMGVVSATLADTKAPRDYSPTAPQADNTNTVSAPPSLYPEIPIEVAQPPPY